MKTKTVMLTALVLLFVLTACGAAKPAENGDAVSSEETGLPAPAEEEDGFIVPKDMDEVRTNVINCFNKMSAVKWQCAGTIDFTGEKSYTANLLYTGNTEYYGLPYTSSRKPGACLEEFSDYLDESGNYIGPVDYRNVVGIDCAAPRLAWAWGGALYDIGMTAEDFLFFDNPAYPSRNPGFVIPVEGYDFSHYDYYLPTEECVMGHNDLKTMCEAYAKLRACDIIGKRWFIQDKIEQHFRMIVEDATVVRNGTGSIAPSKSYVVFSEQTSTPEIIDGKNTTWKIGTKVSFQTLYSNCYIPLTSACLARNTVVTPTLTVSGVNKAENMGTATIFKGNVRSNYNIFIAELDVTDGNGNSVIHSKIYPYALQFNVAEMPVGKKPSQLPPGTYHYTMTATIGFGTKTLIDMEFTK